MAIEREDIQYRGHRIIANKTGAMIYPEKHGIEAESIEAALANAKTWIDAKYEMRSKNRRAEYIGTVDDYADAFAAMSMGSHLTKMLVAHKNAENRRLTAGQLAEAAGWPSFSSANAHYGSLAKDIAMHIGLKIPTSDDAPWTLALAEFEENSSEWIMHEEVAQALDRLNIS